MTKREIDAVFERVRGWPQERQAYAAFLLLDIEREPDELFEMSNEDRAAIEQGLRQCERGEFASDDEVEALFARYRG